MSLDAFANEYWKINIYFLLTDNIIHTFYMGKDFLWHKQSRTLSFDLEQVKFIIYHKDIINLFREQKVKMLPNQQNRCKGYFEETILKNVI